MKQSVINELDNIRKILSKNNPTNFFKSTTKSIAKLLKITEYKTRKYIDMLEIEGFLICKERPRLLGRGKWSKWHIGILKPVKKTKAKKVIKKQKLSICEKCTYRRRTGYFSKVINGIKTNCKSYYCLHYSKNVSGMYSCNYIKYNK